MKKYHDTLNIRKVEVADIGAINTVLLSSKAYWGYDKSFMDAFMDKFSLSEKYIKDNTVYVMSEKTDIIGFFSFCLHNECSLELDHFFISPKYIRQGYGKQLWKDLINIAHALGAKEFILWSDPEAEGFYSKMGCEKIGVKKSPFMPDRYPPVMKYTLKT